MKFQGAYTALVTPMRSDGLDVEALERLVEEQIAGGIDGLVPCGTTGESPTLSHAEHLRVVEIVVKAARGRVPVLAGAGSNSTQEACDLAQACQQLGADGTLQITPYYNKPTQAGLVAHFTAIARASRLPIVVYNVPSRTCCDIEPATLARLYEGSIAVGVKEATGDMHRAARIRELCGDGYALLSGDDFTVLPFLSVGGDGVISVGSNLFPGLFAGLCRAAREGRWDEARALHFRQLPLSRALFSVTSPEPVKAAMAMLGKCEPTIRLPLLPLPDDHPTRAELRRVLETFEANPLEASQ